MNEYIIPAVCNTMRQVDCLKDVNGTVSKKWLIYLESNARNIQRYVHENDCPLEEVESCLDLQYMVQASHDKLAEMTHIKRIKPILQMLQQALQYKSQTA